MRLVIESAADSDFGGLEASAPKWPRRRPPRPLGEEYLTSGDLFGIDKRYHLELGRLTGNRLVENVYAFVIDLLAPTMRPGFRRRNALETRPGLARPNMALALDMVREHDDVWRGLNSEAPGLGAKAV